MKISIITASYNSAATIRQTIESVLQQEYKNVEYIVIDGASKDGTIEVLEEYKDKIKYISEKDKGIYDALNKGINMATGDVVGVIGADDFYPNQHVLEKVANAFRKNNTDSAYGDVQYVKPENIEKIVRYWEAGNFDANQFLYGWMPPHVCFYLKRAKYIKNGLYHTDFKCAADYELMLRNLYKNKISSQYIPEVLLTMRTGGTSTASLKHRWIANQEDHRAWQMNELKPYFFTLWLKPLSKIIQLFKRGR